MPSYKSPTSVDTTFLSQSSIVRVFIHHLTRYSFRKNTESKFSDSPIFYLCPPFRLTAVIFSGKQSVLSKNSNWRRHKKVRDDFCSCLTAGYDRKSSIIEKILLFSRLSVSGWQETLYYQHMIWFLLFSRNYLMLLWWDCLARCFNRLICLTQQSSYMHACYVLDTTETSR